MKSITQDMLYRQSLFFTLKNAPLEEFYGAFLSAKKEEATSAPPNLIRNGMRISSLLFHNIKLTVGALV